ncbi:MAG: GNAT family N-acetyltransferase [Anaerolineaceae bacterium]|nr:GNAT family N-acetyltransferase [Anaerolineaceae bacterium]
MNLSFEDYDPKKHDSHMVTGLMYQADVEMHSHFFGSEKDCLSINEELINLEKKYLKPENIKLALLDDEIVGLAIHFNVSEKSRFDLAIGRLLVKTMGLRWVLKQIFLFIKARNLGGGSMEQDGRYIYNLCVNSAYRGRGIGAALMNRLFEKYHKLYLHVNINNHRGQKFYKRMGFVQKSRRVISYKGKEFGEYLMEKKYIQN